MACEVEVINGPDLTEKESFRDNDSENDILTLKQSLKEKLHSDSVNGAVNGSLNGASCSSSSSSVNNNETTENGLSEEKQGSEIDQETTSKRQTPKKSSKGKRVKAKKLTPSKLKKQSPAKRLDVAVEEESTRSEQSWNGTESGNKDTEDDNSTIDVVGENDEPAVDDIEVSTEDEIRTEISEEKPQEVKEDSTVFSRLRNSMRFSVSPRKPTFTSCSSSEVSSSYGSSYDDDKESQYRFRGISGRRALHHSSFPLESRDAESSFSQQLKRKAQSESPDAPQRKYFITSLTERSPGWKFFSSPFNRFWTPSKKSADVSVSSSTPLRKLHEEVNVEDSMAVNVDESVDITFNEELEVEKENLEKESKGTVADKSFGLEDKESVQTNWRCIVM